MIKSEQVQRKSRPIAIIELLDDGSFRLLPIADSEDDIAEIREVLKDRIKLDE
jgi:hypothetical protein